MTTWEATCAHRVAAHHLDVPAPESALVEVVRAVCGIHAQVQSAAEVSLGIRLDGGTRTAMRDALWESRTLVRTYGPRGTVHVLPADDLGLWVAALAVAGRAVPQTPPEVGLTGDQLTAVLDAIVATLDDVAERGAPPPTWRELGDEVVRRTGPWAADEVFPAFAERWPRWRPAIATAASRGLLVFGPNRGAMVTYERPRPFEPMDGDAALTELARRWLAAYGPGTPRWFAQWLGGSVSAASAAFARLDLAPCRIGDLDAWLPAEARLRESRGAPVVRLLPHFDTYGIGCHPRSFVFPGEASERALSSGSAGTVPVLLVDGVVAGVWQQKRSGRRLTITVEPFRSPDRTSSDDTASASPAPPARELQAAIEHAAARIGEIAEARVDLALGPVTVRRHL